jgi:hypothetical protein
VTPLFCQRGDIDLICIGILLFAAKELLSAANRSRLRCLLAVNRPKDTVRAIASTMDVGK